MPYRHISIMIFALAISACANQQAVIERPFEYSANSTFTIIDERPRSQKVRKIESVNAFSCKYGSYQIADQRGDFGRVDLLADYLQEFAADHIEGEQVSVMNFTLHLNAASQLRDVSFSETLNFYAPGLGLISKRKVKDVVGCSSADLYGGYSRAEAGNSSTPQMVAVVEIEVAGHRFRGRALQPLPGAALNSANPAWNSTVQQALEGASADLVFSLGAQGI